MDWSKVKEQINVDNAWIQFLVVLGVSMLVFTILQCIVLPRVIRKGKSSTFGFQDILAIFHQKTSFFFVIALSVYFATSTLALPDRVLRGMDRFAVLVFGWQVWLWISTLIRVFLDNRAVRLRHTDPEKLGSLRAIRFVLYFLTFVTLTLFILENFGVNVTTLMAGLGVGGIAVALAVQNVLGDFLASLTIIFDKPFIVGDFIVVGDLSGTVESIGIKTTRIRSLSGQEVIVPNSDLLSSRVNNYKRMQERRVVFRMGVTYQTPLAQLKELAAKIRAVVESDKMARFDRCHFVGFGDSSLDFETVYFVKSAEYNDYADLHQRICLKIMDLMENEKIEFAYPTRTLFLEKGNLAIESSQASR